MPCIVTCLFTKQNSFCYIPFKVDFLDSNTCSCLQLYSMNVMVQGSSNGLAVLPSTQLYMWHFLQPLHSSFKPKYTAYDIHITHRKNTTENKLTYAMSIVCLLYPQGFIFKKIVQKVSCSLKKVRKSLEFIIKHHFSCPFLSALNNLDTFSDVFIVLLYITDKKTNLIIS